MTGLPKEPPLALLISMAVRSDHGLGVPGYYDQAIFGGDGIGHARRLEAAIGTMRQLYEEVSGHGFYNPEREGFYLALLHNPGDHEEPSAVAALDNSANKTPSPDVLTTAPEGYVMVPIEPTEAMLAPYRGLNRTRDSRALAMRIYQDMIAASPTPGGYFSDQSGLTSSAADSLTTGDKT